MRRWIRRGHFLFLCSCPANSYSSCSPLIPSLVIHNRAANSRIQTSLVIVIIIIITDVIIIIMADVVSLSMQMSHFHDNALLVGLAAVSDRVSLLSVYYCAFIPQEETSSSGFIVTLVSVFGKSLLWNLFNFFSAKIWFFHIWIHFDSQDFNILIQTELRKFLILRFYHPLRSIACFFFNDNYIGAKNYFLVQPRKQLNRT